MLSYIIELKSTENYYLFFLIIFVRLRRIVFEKEGGRDYESEGPYKSLQSCGICVAFCPKQVLAISEIEKVEVVAEDKCIQCGQCETRCPDFAIFVEK